MPQRFQRLTAPRFAAPRFAAPLFAAALALAAPALFAATPAPANAPASAPAQALSPAVQSAINELSSDDFKTREAALKNLEIALGEQTRALVASDDPETQSRLISLLQFNEGLSRWIIDTYKLPNDQRKTAIDFGLQPDILPTLALVFSSDPDKRVEGARALAKKDSPAATELLGRLLNDPDRAVYLAAMEALWDRKPNDAIVDSLWNRAVEEGMKANRGVAAIPGQNLKFRGRPITGAVVYDYSYIQRSLDGNIATDVLINMKAPQMEAKIKNFLEGYRRATDGSNGNVNLWVYSGNSEPMRNALRLMAAYKSRDTVALLLKIASGPAGQRNQGQVNGEKYAWSSRTSALATLVLTLDLKPEDYNLKRNNLAGGVWTFPSEVDEDAAIKKIQEYCAAHADALGKPTDAADKKTAAITTTTKPADAPASQPGNPQPNNVIIQGNGNFQIRGKIQIQIAPAPNAPGN